MDDMIKELIALDQRARQAIETEKTRRDAAKAKIATERNEIYEAYRKRANAHIEQMRGQAEQNVAEQQTDTVEKFRVSSEKLEQQFTENRGRWVEEIVNRCKQV